MAIKFPLEMKDGVQVRNITDLKKNFDVEKIVGYFLDGKLLTWLEARYYEEEAEAVSKLDSDDSELAKKLCEIFGVEYECEEEIDAEEILRRNERIAKLKLYTEDSEILKSIDNVAFDQEELADLYDKGTKKIYLCEGEFFIPKSKQGLEYILIGEPIVDGLKKNDNKLSNIENTEKCTEQTHYATYGKCNPDYIFDKLADIICWNDYVIADEYIVFSTKTFSFEDDLSPLDVDEKYSEEYGIFRVWDAKRKKLSSFKLTGYEAYTSLIAATGNRVILTKNYQKCDALIYDIENEKIKLICENWSGQEKAISVCNGKIAYIDENKNLYCVNLDTDEKVFIDSLDGDDNNILLKETSVIYVKENKIFQYEFFDKQIKLIKELDISIEELMSHRDKLYVIAGKHSDEFVIFEMDLKNPEKKITEVFKTYISVWNRKLLKKDSYYILLKEESGYPVYAFNANLGTVKKILTDCGYTESKIHWFSDTDYFHYGYRFCVVGNYFFYNKSKNYSSNENYYRLNMLTGELIAQKKKN